MNGQTVAYIRVSSIDQNPDRQIAKVGDVDRTFTDRVSGKSRVDRPELANMLGHVRQGDLVRVASMDRLARSVVDLAQLVKDMTSRGVTVKFVSERHTGAIRLTPVPAQPEPRNLRRIKAEVPLG